jgi:hypothetical protein
MLRVRGIFLDRTFAEGSVLPEVLRSLIITAATIAVKQKVKQSRENHIEEEE